MSATAAYCGELNTPTATPVTRAAAKKTDRDVAALSNIVTTPDAESPPITRARRPSRSHRYPLGITTADIADCICRQRQTSNVEAATKELSTNSGNKTVRVPMTDHPIAKLDSNAGRYAQCRNATRRLIFGRVLGPLAALDHSGHFRPRIPGCRHRRPTPHRGRTDTLIPLTVNTVRSFVASSTHSCYNPTYRRRHPGLVTMVPKR